MKYQAIGVQKIMGTQSRKVLLRSLCVKTGLFSTFSEVNILPSIRNQLSFYQLDPK